MTVFRFGSRQRAFVSPRLAFHPLEPRLASAAYTVNVGGDVTGGFSSTSLRGVVTTLAKFGDTKNSIRFALPAATTIKLAGDLPAVTRNVTIVGQGAASTTVDGFGLYRPFLIDVPGAAGTVTFNRLTITNAAADTGEAVRAATRPN